MKNKKTAALALALAALVCLAGCTGGGETAQQTQGKAAIALTDMMGREITLEKPAERVVALSAADCEILFAIGAGDSLVGRGEYCDYPAAALAAPAVQSGAETNIERIIALEPDAVLMATMSQTEAQVAALESAGIAVVVSNAADIEGVYQSIAIIGELTGKSESAAAVAEGMKATFEELRQKTEGASGGSVYFEVSPLEYGLWTAGSGTFMNEIADMLGLVNAFADLQGWGEISAEQVIERNPDYIVTLSVPTVGGETPADEIASRAGWQGIAAVKNAAILNLADNELTRPSPRLADGARALYDFISGAQEAAA